MSLSRTAVVLLGCGALGLAVVGVGAGASFTDATHSVQTITSGTLNMTLSAPDAPTATVSADGKTVTLADTSPVGSTFKSAAVTFLITNSGTIAANEVFIAATDTHAATGAGDALMAQSSVCIYSPFISNANPGGVVFNGLLSAFEASGQQVAGNVAPGDNDRYTAEYYAGAVTTACGASTAPSLTNEAQGGTLTPMITLSYTD